MKSQVMQRANHQLEMVKQQEQQALKSPIIPKDSASLILKTPLLKFYSYLDVAFSLGEIPKRKLRICLKLRVTNCPKPLSIPKLILTSTRSPTTATLTNRSLYP